MTRAFLKAPLILTAAFASVAARQPVASYDLIIRNGRVLDGTGNPWFPAEVEVRGGRIVSVGALPDAQATRVVDAADRYVAPGFIDNRSHADDGSGPCGGFRDHGWPGPGRCSAAEGRIMQPRKSIGVPAVTVLLARPLA
jgi:hypothetical protein